MITLAIFSLHTCPLASIEGKETGGLNVFVLETAKELGKMGFRVDMFTRSQNKKEPHIVNISQNVRLIHLIVGPEKPIAKKLLFPYIKSFTKAFFEFSRQDGVKYDLIHCHYYLSGLAGIAVKKKLRIPLITSFHTLALMKNLVGRTVDEREEKKRLTAETKLINESDAIVASSSNDKAYLEYLYGCPTGKIYIGNPGVDTHLFFPMSKNKAKDAIGAAHNLKIILAVGRIEPLKGFDSLLYALKILLVKRPELRKGLSLYIVGGDTSESINLWSNELRHLEKLQRELGLAALVKFIGQKGQKDLHFYYSSAEAVIMPSHYESFGMVALEAMACGTPVVISNVSGVSDLVSSRGAGLVTTVNNPLLLEKQIEEIITGDSARTDLKTRNKVREFTWLRTSVSLMKVYLKYVKLRHGKTTGITGGN